MARNPRVLAVTSVICSAPCTILSMVWVGNTVGSTLQVSDASGGNRLIYRNGIGADMNVITEPMMFTYAYLTVISAGELEIQYA